jgi:uncharacterized protein (DUF1499 family)
MRRVRRSLMAVGVFALLAGCDPVDAEVDFATLARTDASNQYLVCPPDRCGGKADAPSPEFDLPAAALAAIVRRALESEPRTRLLREDADRGQLVYVQRSLLFRFPDTIWIEPVALGASRSTLAIYSRSAYGRYDFGVNRARVERWLAVITRAAVAGN